MMKVGLAASLLLLFALPASAADRPTRESNAVKRLIEARPRVYWQDYRFLTFASADDTSGKLATRFVLASLNRTSVGLDRIIYELSPTVWAINTKKIGWPAGSWEKQVVAARRPYYQGTSRRLQDFFKDRTGSRFPIMRADAFAADGWSSKWYVHFMRLPATREGLLKELGVDMRLPVSVATISRKLTVTQHPGRVARYESKSGRAVWIRMNYEDTRDEKDVRANPLATKCDYNEVAFEMPNGLDAFASFDGETGKLSRFSDTSVAMDRRHGVVELGRSCFACHDKGMRELNHADGFTSLSLAPTRANRYLFSKDRLARFVGADRERFSRAVRRATGKSAEDVSKAVLASEKRFAADLTVSDVAAELGVSETLARKCLGTATTISRERFERNYVRWLPRN